jgi:flagellin-like protein
MELKQLLTDDEAVSPVIGVILMVAITVILAAVIGTFVLGLGDQVQSTSPQASFNFDFTDEDGSGQDELTVTHDGGDTIGDTQLYLKSDASFDTNDDDGSTADAASTFTWDSLFSPSGDEVSAGTSGTVHADTNSDEFNSATFRVTWSSSDGSNTATLGKWSGPDA